MSETILVAGATGFTGGYTVPLIVQQGYKVRCLIRERSHAKQFEHPRVELVYGDLDAPESLKQAFDGVSGLISIVGLHTGHAVPLVDMAVAGGIKRALFVSSTSVLTRPDTRTKSFLLDAEQHIHGSGLNYTIIRPTMIYGTEMDGNISRLIRFLARWPVLFIPGPGTCLVQPIFVADVAKAIVDAYQSPRAVNKSYNIAGRESLTFNALADTISSTLNRKHLKIHLPTAPLITVCKWVESRGRSFFVRSDQIERLNEDKAFAYDEAVKDFQFSPVPFEVGIKHEVKDMGLFP